MVRNLFIDWIINLVNLLIYIMIFMKAVGRPIFNTFDLTAALIGIAAGVLWLFIKTLKE
jgi:hypothetical protein